MIQQIKNLLQQYLPSSIKVHLLILNNVKIKKYKKGELFLEVGEVCDKAFYLHNGFLRGYVLDANKTKITCWFKWEKEFVTSINSFSTGTASEIGIEFIEDSTIFYLKKEVLQKCSSVDLKAAVFYIHNLEKNFVRLEKQIISLITQSATDRYLQLIEEHPLIIQRAPLSYIASYLGITQSSLSRLRAKYQK